METPCLRGFSNTFLPDSNMEEQHRKMPPSMQYIDGSELERTWKTARRQRLKQQEDKIWSEFVKENDVLQAVSEDPYQFLEQLPEACLKDLMDTELERMKIEAMEESAKEQKRGAGDTPRVEDHTMTFTEMEQDDLFRIFDEDRDDNDELSGIEEDMGNDSVDSPCTVRERDGCDTPERMPSGRPESPERCVQATSSKSSENVANVIESSIYCAKVRDLRAKMNTALNNIIGAIEGVNVACMEPQLLRKMVRRAAEFTSRFQRIHLYQIQRQIHDIKRQNSLALPFAKHTQFQSQMVRIVALHQYMLQALNVFLKSIEKTSCLRDSGEQLSALCASVLESVQVCRTCAPPHDFNTAFELYNDDVESSCEKLMTSLKDYTERVNDFVDAAHNNPSGGHGHGHARAHAAAARSKKNGKAKDRKRKIGAYSKSIKSNSKSDATARLSMYSLETLRRQHSKIHTPKDNAKVDKARRLEVKDGEKTPKSHRKSPRSRRPLMRDPAAGAGAAAARRRPPDTDIHTMVEAYGPPSSHMSREASPRRASRQRRSARSPPAPAPPPPPAASTARAVLPAPAPAPRPPSPPPRQTAAPTPRSPAYTPRTVAKRNLHVKQIHTSFRSETQDTMSSEPIAPVSLVQCAKRQPSPLASFMDECLETKQEDDGRTESARKSSNSLRTEFESPSSASGSDLKESVYKQGSSARLNNNRKDKDKQGTDPDPAGCEVTRLLRQLCGGDGVGSKTEKYSGAKNAQLLCVNGGSPRQPTTPQLLRILEETIQKKVPKQLYHKSKPKDADRLRLAFNIPQPTADKLFQYRTKFVQHMLTSSLYANSAVGKPWEMIGSVSERIIEEILTKCMKEMEISAAVLELYESETH